MEQQTDAEAKIQAISSMMQTQGWYYLVEMLETKIEELQKEILGENGIKAENNKVMYTHNDIIRMEYKLLKDLKNYPNETLQNLKDNLNAQTTNRRNDI